jgi:hypothetical protein
MKTRVELHTKDQRIKLSVNGDGSAAWLDAPCPKCGAEAPVPIAGNGRSIGGHDYYKADGYAMCCNTYVGEIRAYVSTLFGIAEDEAVARMGVKIY